MYLPSHRNVLLHTRESATKVSKLSAIQLVAIVKTTVLAIYGMDAVLQPFVNDLMKLVGNLHNYSSNLLKALMFL